MQRNLKSSHVLLNVIDGVFGETQQAMRRMSNPSERDRMQQDRTPFPLCGDSEPDMPPLAWTTIWNETYSNLYGWYTSD